jgi:hypothetical protein
VYRGRNHRRKAIASAAGLRSESSAADSVVIGAATIADVGDKVVRGDESEGKKCKDEVHDLLLRCC